MTSTPTYRYDYFSKNIGRFRKHLADLSQRSCSILEIGCFEGRCTNWMLHNLAVHRQSTITCIDIWIQPLFAENIERNPKVTTFEGKSVGILPTLPNNYYDFIYVDGGHETIEVLEDAVLSFNLLKVGGVVAFDDYRWENKIKGQRGNVPRPAIDAFCKLYRKKIEVLTHRWCYQKWVRKLVG